VAQPGCNRNDYIFEAYAEAHELIALVSQLPTGMARKTDTMDVLDLVVLKKICLPTAIETLNEWPLLIFFLCCSKWETKRKR
jgi:hypothetical protein